MNSLISITTEPIDLERIISDLSDESVGSTTIFIGTVRNNDAGEKVLGITYEVYYEMALEHLERVKNEIDARWAVSKFTAIQRTGFVKAGETSVVVAAASVHRKDAFDACRYGI